MVAQKNPEKYKRILHHGINILILALITFEGHLGGQLTHGTAYLFEYAPDSVRNFMLDEKEEMINLSKADSVLVYDDLIKPIFEQKCFACHNNEVQCGKLNMASIYSMLLGGEEGPAFMAGNLRESELI